MLFESVRRFPAVLPPPHCSSSPPAGRRRPTPRLVPTLDSNLALRTQFVPLKPPPWRPIPGSVGAIRAPPIRRPLTACGCCSAVHMDGIVVVGEEEGRGTDAV